MVSFCHLHAGTSSRMVLSSRAQDTMKCGRLYGVLEGSELASLLGRQLSGEAAFWSGSFPETAIILCDISFITVDVGAVFLLGPILTSVFRCNARATV